MRIPISMMAVIHCSWIALLVVSLLLVPAVQAQDNAPVTVRLQAPAQVVLGEAIALTLQVSAGSDVIGGMEALTLFDATVAEFAGFYPSLPNTQQGLGTLIVPETPVGAAVGFFTCATPECQEVGVALVEMANVGIASVAPDLLATVEVLPLVAGQLEIRLDNLQLVDHTGRNLPVVVEQASVTVQVGEGGEPHPAPAKPWDVAVAQAAVELPAGAADVTGDQTISHADVMETAIGWHIAHEQLAACAGVEPATDLNKDGCVTVADVQLAAANIGATVPETEPLPIDPEQFPNQIYMPSLHSDNNGENGASGTDGTEENIDAAAALTFVVNSVADQADANMGDGICRTAQGVCTLRAAIVEANRHSGLDYIRFSIPGSGVKTIQLNSRLPTLSGGSTNINGYSQPGAAVNTDARVSNARILIQVRGQDLAFDGLVITSAYNVVRGIAFFNLKRSLWIYGSGARQNRVIGNIIGTDAATTYLPPDATTQQAHGVMIEQGAQQNRVGGTTPAERNVISGNRRSGVGLWHWPTSYNIIYNNLVGLSANGNQRVANRAHGIDMNVGASYNTIGGTDPGQRNVVSGNSLRGIEVSHGQSTRDNQIIGNYVGTYPNGNVVGGVTQNGGFGIQLKDRVRNNTIAHNVIGNNNQAGIRLDNFGTCCLQGNVIEHNRIGIGSNNAAIGNNGRGVWITAPGSRIGPGNIIANNTNGGIVIEGAANDGNTITQNSIFANAGLGIDLAPIGVVNSNDGGDGDSGPNEQQNFPLIQSARPTVVSGWSCNGCRVEIFIATGQGGAYGQGRTFVGAATAGSNGAFSVSVTGVVVGNFVTATATNAAGNTSEFSANVRVQ